MEKRDVRVEAGDCGASGACGRGPSMVGEGKERVKTVSVEDVLLNKGLVFKTCCGLSQAGRWTSLSERGSASQGSAS